MMKEIVADSRLVANCGLYCGACPAYLKDRCTGCHANDRATWCKIRSCCKEHTFATCAECKQYSNVNNCGKFNNFISKIFAFIFRSNRAACIRQIVETSLEQHAENMAKNRRQTIQK